MSRPLISVLIPAYNAERWIGDAIRSVQAQTIAGWELIVVNDGSTDGTSEVVRATADPRIRLVEQPNAGVSPARNKALEHARGEHIAFLDADDAMLPGNLELKHALLVRSGVDWVYGDLQPCDDNLRPTGEPLRATDGDVVRTILLGQATAIPAPCSNLLAHRRCFGSGLRFDENLSNAADQDIALGLARRFSHAHLPQALTLYRVLPGSMSRSVALYQDDHLRLFAKARATGLLDDPSFRRQCMANAYWSIGGSWWRNAHEPGKALPFLLRAALRRPSLLLRPFRRARP